MNVLRINVALSVLAMSYSSYVGDKACVYLFYFKFIEINEYVVIQLNDNLIDKRHATH